MVQSLRGLPQNFKVHKNQNYNSKIRYGKSDRDLNPWLYTCIPII